MGVRYDSRSCYARHKVTVCAAEGASRYDQATCVSRLLRAHFSLFKMLL